MKEGSADMGFWKLILTFFFWSESAVVNVLCQILQTSACGVQYIHLLILDKVIIVYWFT